MHDGGKNDLPVVRAEVGGQVFTVEGTVVLKPCANHNPPSLINIGVRDIPNPIVGRRQTYWYVTILYV
jgi:hypothetical protein